MRAIATDCHDDVCWRPVGVPAGSAFVSTDMAIACVVLFVLCLPTLVHRLGRG